jgi:tRNA (cytidine/uridine-2'-O-)-methyltransferase
MLDVVLVSPEIPQNTGSIARMCAATGVGLHLVGNLGFSLDDRYLKRAGLDYWGDVCTGIHRDIDALLAIAGDRPIYFFSKRGDRRYTDIEYSGDELLVFGPESVGLPGELLARFPGRVLRLPIRSNARSLNLAAAVHVAVYHILAQHGFAGIV